jgi:uncharacterized membrane protein
MDANTRTFAATLVSVAALSLPSHPAYADTSIRSGCMHLRYSAVPIAARDGTALFADDLNDKGQVVGHIFDDSTATTEAILWRDGRYVRLGDRIRAGALETTAIAVNNRTQIVGTFTDPDFNSGDYLLDRRGVTYLVAPFASPQEVNDHGVIAGTASSDGVDHGAVWRNGETVLLPMAPGDVGASTADINNNGTVVGRGVSSGSGLEALVWFAPYTSAPTVLPLPPNADRSQGALGVNNRDQVIFVADDLDTFVTRSYLWSVDRPLQELQPLPGAVNTIALDINSDGLIVGFSAGSGESPTVATVWRGGEVCALEDLVKTPPGLAGRWADGFRVNELGEILAFRAGSSVGGGYFVLRPRR